MSNRYKLVESEDGLSYQFYTEKNDQYTVYFTEFHLQDQLGKDIVVPMFGFSRTKTSESFEEKEEYDERIKNTIQYIIAEFFRKNNIFCHQDSSGRLTHRLRLI